MQAFSSKICCEICYYLLALPAGFEPATLRLVDGYSIQTELREPGGSQSETLHFIREAFRVCGCV